MKFEYGGGGSGFAGLCCLGGLGGLGGLGIRTFLTRGDFGFLDNAISLA
jgi:hypothetical protein